MGLIRSRGVGRYTLAGGNQIRTAIVGSPQQFDIRHLMERYEQLLR